MPRQVHGFGCACSLAIAGRYREAQLALFRILLNSPGTVVLCYSENPVEEGLAGNWLRLVGSEKHWIMAGALSIVETLDWLHLGAWTAYRFREEFRPQPWAIPARRVTEEVWASMTAKGIDVVIEAFHDNDEFDLYLAGE